MVHKKYIKRGKKVFGPYFYENYRDSAGETRTRYLGTKKPEKIKEKKSLLNKNFNIRYLFIMLGVVGIISILILLSFFFRGLTGRATLEVASSYSIGEQISGNLILNLKQGELIPVESSVRIKLGNQEKEILLEDLIDNKIVSGNYYAEDIDGLIGDGEGYGVVGEKEIYPRVFFDLIISEEGKKETKTEEEIPAEENISPEEQPKTETQTPAETGKVTEGETGSVSQETSAETIPQQQTPAETQTTPVESAGETQTSTEQSTPAEEQTTPTESSSTESPSESIPESSPITGGVISENLKIVSGSVSADEPFSYSLEEGESAEIEPESVKTDSKKLSKNGIDLEIKDNQAVVTTNYFEFEKGFGKEYINDKTIKLNLDLSKFGITAEEGEILVYLFYNNAEIVSVSEKISVVQQIENETIKENITEQNVTIANITEQNVTVINETITNITIVNETITNVSIGNLSIETIQYGAVVGKPVKWKKTIISDIPTNVSVEIPKSAQNISVYKIEGVERLEIGEGTSGEEQTPAETQTTPTEQPQTEKNVSNEENNFTITSPLTPVSPDSSINRLNQSPSGSEASVNNGEEKRTAISDENVSIITSVISGQVSAEIELDNRRGFNVFKFFKSLFSKFTGKAVVTEESLEKKEVIITENASEYEIEYETPAPVAYEQETSSGKLITISGPEELNYTNVLAFAELPYEVPENQIRLYHYIWINETREIVNASGDANQSTLLSGSTINMGYWTKEEVPTDDYDLNNDSLIDYIEWIVPHLSNQTYELIIEISKAEHLDENRTFIEDIYESVKAQDGNWSPVINDSHYVRVTFEKNLTSERDITIYARALNKSVIIDGQEVPYDVYLKKKRIDELRGMLNG